MSFTDILPWWTWLFGSVGLAGAIALMVLAPAAAAAAEQTLAAVVGRMLQTRIGVAMIVGAIALFVGHLHGALYVENKCEGRLESQRQASAAAGVKRDTSIENATVQKYTPVVAGLEQQADQFQQWVGTYERNKLAELAQAPGAAAQCQLGDRALQLRRGRKAAVAAARGSDGAAYLRGAAAAADAAGHPAD